MSVGQFKTRLALATAFFGLSAMPTMAQEITKEEIRLLKARTLPLEAKVARQERAQRTARP